MHSEPAQVIQTLVSDEIRRIVADAVGDGMCISARASATRILSTYPDCGLEEREIIDEIVAAASAKGVAIEDVPRAPASWRDGADRTDFGVLFAQSEELYATIDEMIASADGAIDPVEMTGKLIEEKPGLEFTETELQTVVRKVATVAGKPIKRGEVAQRDSTYSRTSRSKLEDSSGLSK